MRAGINYNHPGTIETMRELRENGWTLAGIARVYDITVPALRLLIHEEDPDRPCPLHPGRGWGHD